MVIRHILQYLTDHPEARDTLPGIRCWWLPKGPAERAESEVQEVLDSLVARGWVTQRQTTPSQTLYGLNTEKLEEIEAFLRECESNTKGHRE